MKKVIPYLFLIMLACSREPGSGIGECPNCKLVWVSYRSGPPNIWLMDLPDGKPTQLTYFTEGCGRWGIAHSSDGWIYFCGKKENVWQLFRVHEEGGEPQMLTDSDQYDGDPTVSPDGARICFLTKRWFFSTYDRELAMISASGGAVMRLTYREGSDDSPVFSPLGDVIAYVEEGLYGSTRIATLNPDAPNEKRYITPIEDDAYSPAYLPDGSLVFVLTRAGTRDIWRTTASGELINLTNSPEADENPSPSPDGRFVVHQIYRSGSWDIATTATDGSGTSVLVEHPAEDISPCFSPDGSWIFWVSSREGDRELYGADIIEKRAIRITYSAGDDIRPQCWE